MGAIVNGEYKAYTPAVIQTMQNVVDFERYLADVPQIFAQALQFLNNHPVCCTLLFTFSNIVNIHREWGPKRVSSLLQKLGFEYSDFKNQDRLPGALRHFNYGTLKLDVDILI